MRKHVVLLGLACFFLTDAASAQIYPSKPVRIIVPYSAGAPSDIIARIITAKMAEYLGQIIVIENKGGADGQVGAQFVASAVPDGYTLCACVKGNTIVMPAARSVKGKMLYDPINAFTPVGFTFESTFVLVVHKDVSATSMEELIAYAKAHPQRLNFGVANPLGVMGTALLQRRGVPIVAIPYGRGGAQPYPDLVAGRIQAMISSYFGVMPHVESGMLRMVGTLGTKRHYLQPEIPTLAEQGLPDFLQFDNWGAFLAPRGTPQPVIKALNSALNKSLTDPQVAQAMQVRGYLPRSSTFEELSAAIRQEFEVWKKFVGDTGVELE